MLTKTKSIYLLAVLGSALLLLTSCKVYKPTGYNTLTQNVPLLKEKGELQAMFTFGFNSLEEHVAFSPTDHLALLGSFYQSWGATKVNSAEGGIGYHNTFSEDCVWEVYGIFTNAYNHAYRQDYAGTHDLNVKYNGYSLQFDIGKRTPNSDIGISLRYGLIEYSNFYYHLGTYGYSLSDTTYYLNNNLHNFFTIAPTFKFGSTNFKFLVQFSYHVDLSRSLTGSPEETPPYYSPLLVSFGLVGNIFFKKKK